MCHFIQRKTSPRITSTAFPPTRTLTTRLMLRVASTKILLGRSISIPCSIRTRSSGCAGHVFDFSLLLPYPNVVGVVVCPFGGSDVGRSISTDAPVGHLFYRPAGVRSQEIA